MLSLKPKTPDPGWCRVLAGLMVFLAVRASGAVPDGAWQQGAGFRFRDVASHRAEGGSGGRTVGFTSVPAAISGVTFSNALPVAAVIENHNLLTGSGVAAGDFDGDGWCDLFFVAIHGTNALYRNLGGWRFADVTAEAGLVRTGVHPTGALFADTDGDGDLDLLVGTLGQGVRFHENVGRGRFREATSAVGLGSETGSTSLAVADVDGDGDLDLYVANYGAMAILRSGGRADVRKVGERWEVTGPHAKRLRYVDGRLEELGEPDVLYLNDGRGRFRPVPWNSEFFLDEQGRPKAEPWDFGLTVQMRDLNGDRAPDIYVCNDFQTVDRFWLNDGRGRFRAVPRVAVRKQSFSSMAVDFGDINRDGHPDYFVTEMMARDHALRLRQLIGLTPLIPEPGRIENRPEVARNTLQLNRGDGTFAEIAHAAGVAASEWSWQALFLDVDLDGFEDLLIGNGTMFDVQDRDVLLRIRSFGRQSPEQSRTNLLLYPPWITRDQALRNRGNLTFEETSAAWGFDGERITQGMVQADLDNDGDLDLALNGVATGAALLRNEAVVPRVAVRLKGRPPNGRGVGALIRVTAPGLPVQTQEILGGGHYLSCSDTLRVFAAGHVTNRVAIEVRWRGGGTTRQTELPVQRIYEFEEPAAEEGLAQGTTVQTNPPPSASHFRDVSAWLGHAHREQMFPDYERQPLLLKQFSQLGPGVAWFDLDGDGQEELFVGAARGGLLEAFTWDGTNRFLPLPTAAKTPVPDDLTGLAGWVSATGQRSILAGLSHYESKTPYKAALARGTIARNGASFEVAPDTVVPGMASVPGPLAVADLDGDGDLDLFVGGRVVPGSYPEAAVSRVFRQEASGLVLDEGNTRALAAVGLVSGAVWSDLDGDGWAELVLACEFGPVRVFQNQRGLLTDATEKSGLSAWSGWWSGVSTGDFDGDGRLDIVAGNWGLNTPFRASAAHPWRLYFGDLTGVGATDLIETEFVSELGGDAPTRSLNALSRAFPMLQGRFGSHRAFGSATIQSLLEVLPRPARSVQVTSFASMLFLNRGDRFEAAPLPAEAQFAPALAVNVADFDADGHEDLFLSQNFFALRPEVPRLDAGRGLWLRGNGRGQLTPVPGQESGVMVYGEQRGAALGDFNADGRVDLVVTQNSAPTRVFLNVSKRQGLRIRLQGPVGNPHGIGARVRLVTPAGAGPVREVHGGSGYWSQDSAIPVLAAPDGVAAVEVVWPGGKTTRGPVREDATGCIVSFTGSVQSIGARSPAPSARAVSRPAGTVNR